jgi:EmrB/QacA subfamily drug resistance transporter
MARTTAPQAAAPGRLDPYLWTLAPVVVLGSIMSVLDTTIVNVALETLSKDFHDKVVTIQWVVTGYLLSLAAVIPVSGWAARRFGAKNVWLLSVVLFTAGSALCGLSHSTSELIAFRVVQGVGGGMILPVGQMMIANTAGPQNMGRVMSIISIPTLLAPILGPVLGGVILQNLSWRWIFFVNVPIGIIAVIAGLRVMRSVKSTTTEPLDYTGLILLALGMPLLTYGLAEIGTVGTIDSVRVIGPVLVGIALIVGFVFHALRLRGRRPLLELRLYRRRTFSSASLAIFCLGAAMFGSMILLPLYFQTIRHESVIDTGLLTGPQGIGMIVMMPFIGKLTDRYGGGILALGGAILTTVATVPFALIGAHTSLVTLMIGMTIRGVGIGFGFMPAMTAAFAALKREELSDATPQLNVLMRVGGSIGTAILAVVLQRAQAGSHTLAGAAGAYGTAFWWTLGLTAMSILPCIVLMRAERRARQDKRAAAEEQAAPEVGALAEVMA